MLRGRWRADRTGRAEKRRLGSAPQGEAPGAGTAEHGRSRVAADQAPSAAMGRRSRISAQPRARISAATRPLSSSGGRVKGAGAAASRRAWPAAKRLACSARWRGPSPPGSAMKTGAAVASASDSMETLSPVTTTASAQARKPAIGVRPGIAPAVQPVRHPGQGGGQRGGRGGAGAAAGAWPARCRRSPRPGRRCAAAMAGSMPSARTVPPTSSATRGARQRGQRRPFRPRRRQPRPATCGGWRRGSAGCSSPPRGRSCRPSTSRSKRARAEAGPHAMHRRAPPAAPARAPPARRGARPRAPAAARAGGAGARRSRRQPGQARPGPGQARQRRPRPAARCGRARPAVRRCRAPAPRCRRAGPPAPRRPPSSGHGRRARARLRGMADRRRQGTRHGRHPTRLRLGPGRRADHRAHPAGDQGGEFPPGGALHLHQRLEEPGLHRLPQDHLLPPRPEPHLRPRRSRRSAGTSATRSIDVVAGGETAGIPFAAWIADRMMAPMAYVRKKPKGFGRGAQIEGDVPEGKQHPAGRGPDHRRRQQDPLRPGAARRRGDLRPHLRRVLLRRLPRQLRDDEGAWACPCTTSAPGGTCWRCAASGPISPRAALKEVRKFLENPVGWSKAHGGIGSAGGSRGRRTLE